MKEKNKYLPRRTLSIASLPLRLSRSFACTRSRIFECAAPAYIAISAARVSERSPASTRRRRYSPISPSSSKAPIMFKV